jgi:phosphopantetheine--protein transferase-like protein
MVMEKNIQEIYSKLSGGKQITSEEQTISKGDFNSIMIDRFKAELSKMGISWNGENIQVKNLIPGINPVAVSEKSNGVVRDTTITKNNFSSTDLSVGIDIQNIGELPESSDFWEDVFYKTKFKPEEIGYCVKKENVRQSFAGIYAAKEALIKCDNKLNWDDIIILHDENNKPECDGFVISISHSGENAVAVAIKNTGSISANENNFKTQNNIAETISSNANKPQSKNYGAFYFTAILAIIIYLVVRDLVWKN